MPGTTHGFVSEAFAGIEIRWCRRHLLVYQTTQDSGSHADEGVKASHVKFLLVRGISEFVSELVQTSNGTTVATMFWSWVGN